MIASFHIVLAMKPISGNFAENAIEHGIAGLNIDAGRIKGAKGQGVWGTSNATINKDRKFNASPDMGEYRSEEHTLGRWPANLILEGIDEVKSLFPETTSGAMKHEVEAYDGDSITGFLRGRSGPSNQHGDSGSAARFFKQISTK